MKKLFYFFACAGLLLTACTNAPVTVTNLRCESLTDPVGIDIAAPRLSWELSSDASGIRQIGYRIIVASSLDRLNADEGDLWDSKFVKSDNTLYIPYSGSELKSRMKCYWKVKVATNKGHTEWSHPASWSMALVEPSDWKAEWTGLDKSFKGDVLEKNTRLSARYFRKEFSLEEKTIANATLYITGLGFYEAYINGKRVGMQVFSPAATDYSKAVKYNTFDVTELLKAGANAIGVVLGNGRFFSMRQPGIRHFGFPKMIAQLEVTYTDGSRQTIASDTSWKVTANGPIRSNSEFDGEEYDARMEMPGWTLAGFNDKNWLQAEKTEAPGGKLEAQRNLNIQIMETISPVAISELKPCMYILDMGQNMVGRLNIKVKGKAGDQVKLRFAETLKKDGSLYMDNLRGALVTDKYTLKGDSLEIWEPAFTYHGFRFVEITGFPGTPALSDFEGKVMYDEMDVTGKFETSNDMINKIYKNAYWGIRGNYRSMPTDCPQRDERMGWLGDRAVGSLGESFIFDNRLLYAKWLDDIEQAQHENGSIPDVAPNYWQIYSDNMTWPGAYIIIANMLYDQFGDKEPIIRHYDSMKKWMNYMKEKYMVDYIMPKDTYGDWCMPPESPELIHSKDSTRITAPAVLGTTFYYYLTTLLNRFALLLDKPDEAKQFAQEAESVKNAFNNKFLNKTAGFYSNNTVTANILPLRFGMVPEEYRDAVFKNIVDKTMGDFKGHVSAGLVGIQQLMRGLSDYGRTDIAYQIAANTTYPSWGYMVENGATTIWELWNGNTADPAMNSGNHVMLLGDLIAWYYGYLAGIQNAPGSVGYKQIVFKPYLPQGLDYVNASFQSVRGPIGSAWQIETGAFVWIIKVPANCSATVYVPASGKEAVKAPVGAKYIEMKNGYAVFKVESGTYRFNSKL